jgi:SAM-dependent methyltransferase
MSETPSSYFEQLWSTSADPWDHAGRWYEARKYDLTVAALPYQRYVHAVEPACGPGVLTARLAARADRVTASDRFAAAVDATRARCHHLSNVTAHVGDIRDGPPDEPYDLAVIGECLYYLPLETVVEVLRAWHGRCSPRGHVELVHYRRTVPEHVFTGDDVHTIAHDLLGPPVVELLDPDFRVAVFDAPS